MTTLNEMNGSLRPNYPIIPEGWHDLEVLSVDDRVSQKGNPYLLVRCSTTTGKFRHLYECLLTDPKSPPMTLNAEKFLKEKFQSAQHAMGGDIKAGARFNARIAHEEYQGETKAKIRLFRPCAKKPKLDDEIPF